jgi:hypothetical protein
MNIVNVPQHKFQLFLNRLEGSLYQINFGIDLPDIVWNYSRVNKISTRIRRKEKREIENVRQK